MLSRSSLRLTRLVRPSATRLFNAQLSHTSHSKAEVKAKHSISSINDHSINQGQDGALRILSKNTYNVLPPTMQLMTLMEKVVIVTGGARGLGYNMAQACVEAGAKAIIILDQNEKLGKEAALKLHKATGETIPVSFYSVDVSDEASISKTFDELIKENGLPDVLINSAGIADSNIPAETYDTKLFARLIDINLNGSFLMAQAVGKRLIEAKKPGSIVLIASMSGGVVNYPQEQSCYNASKAGVIMLGKSLAAEWAKFGIRVNIISPGYMDTALNNVPALDAQKKIWKSLTPQKRLGAVDDLNGIAVLLASDASAFMTGSNIVIDGGYTLY
ncbi:D-arabinitol 2-dehydrogenase [Golovinomyces cichoracearum]|uniref:D-arabinitol 2-dehydrogenase n=1 Tax=Golovinomyces cichoracearum TaxID=62708 RepID=A0A420J0M7_9PEZI|nr:D-arabinitol 2-dehydrogenase [Golovinomyces cichoracearum]